MFPTNHLTSFSALTLVTYRTFRPLRLRSLQLLKLTFDEAKATES